MFFKLIICKSFIHNLKVKYYYDASTLLCNCTKLITRYMPNVNLNQILESITHAMPLYKLQCLTLTKDKPRKKETTELHFLRAIEYAE